MSPASAQPASAAPRPADPTLPTRATSCADTGAGRGAQSRRGADREVAGRPGRVAALPGPGHRPPLPARPRRTVPGADAEHAPAQHDGRRGKPRSRTWLARRVDWTAKDMLRRRGRRGVGRRRGSRGHRARDDPPPACVRPAGPVTLDVKHLVSWGSPLHEAQVVAFRCTGVDMPLKDFAELVHRSYASVRKEFERGTRKIEELFGLTAEEVHVVRAWRKHGTAAATAPHVNRSGDEVIQILEGAHKKIDRIFDRDGGSSVMSAELPDHEFGAARAPGKTDAGPVTHLGHERAVRFTRRLGRAADLARHPVVRLRHIARGRRTDRRDPAAGADSDRVVDDLLCIEFDGVDSEAFPTSLCLTGFTDSALLPRGECGAPPARRDALPGGRGHGVRWRRRAGGPPRRVGAGLPCAHVAAADGAGDRDRDPAGRAARGAGGSGRGDHRTRRSGPSPRCRRGSHGGDRRAGGRTFVPPAPGADRRHAGPPRCADRRPGRCPYRGGAPLPQARPRGPNRSVGGRPACRDGRAATGLRTHVLNDVVGYATYDRWFYPVDPDERCRAVTPDLPGHRRQADHQRRRVDTHADGDRQLHAARERCRVRVRQVRMPGGDGQHARDRRPCSGGQRADRRRHRLRRGARGADRGVQRPRDRGLPDGWPRPRPRDLDGPGDRDTRLRGRSTARRASSRRAPAPETPSSAASKTTTSGWPSTPTRTARSGGGPIEGDEGAHGAALVALEDSASPARIPETSRRRARLRRMVWRGMACTSPGAHPPFRCPASRVEVTCAPPSKAGPNPLWAQRRYSLRTVGRLRRRWLRSARRRRVADAVEVRGRRGSSHFAAHVRTDGYERYQVSSQLGTRSATGRRRFWSSPERAVSGSRSGRTRTSSSSTSATLLPGRTDRGRCTSQRPGHYLADVLRELRQ